MQGQLRKLQAVFNTPIQYALPLSDQLVQLNPLMGKNLRLSYTGNIFCLHCGKASKKSFSQGYCYRCFISLAQCDLCIMKPEICHFSAGTCREPVWAEQFCFQPHFVYLANSSGIKVGITRQNQIPTRWIDQGAIQALPIFKVQSRQQSGFIEVMLAKHVSDKTSWQKMLKSQVESMDLITKRDALLAICTEELMQIQQRFGVSAIEFLSEANVTTIDYPVETYPSKIKSLSFDTTPEISGVLLGIKGQYLLLDTGVLNIRKFTGYEVEFVA